MNRDNWIIFNFFMIFMICLNFVSSEIVLNGKLNNVYNLGNSIKIPLTIKVLEDTSGILELNLLCGNGTQINFYKNGVYLLSGEETTLNSILVLIPEIIGENKGDCKIKVSINEDFILTEEFKISDLLIIQSNLGKDNFNPEEEVLISGTVKREDETSSNGFIDFILKDNDNEILKQSSTINKGNFNGKITLPKDIEAKKYTIVINSYEKNKAGKIINKGENNLTISINQIPKNISILLNKEKLNPEEILTGKIVLYDQTGKTIDFLGNVSILDKNNNILKKEEIQTGQEFEYKIKKMEIPSNLSVKAEFWGLEQIKSFEIKDYENLEILLENKTLTISNYGNIPYNKTLLLDIGNKSLDLNLSLDVGETKKYLLTAPNGEYEVKIYTGENSEVIKKMSLTGNAINIKEIKNNSLNYYFYGVIFIILMIFLLKFLIKHKRKNKFKNKKEKKLSKGTLIKEKNTPDNDFPIIIKKQEKDKNKNEEEKEFIPIEIYEAKKEDKISKRGIEISNNFLLNKKNKAELSLSLQGQNQKASMICLKIKDLEYYLSTNTSINESLTRILQITERNKGIYYINRDYLFLIFVPSKTKTIQNEEISLRVSEEILKVLNEHNKKFLQKIDFGISLNTGNMILNEDANSIKFMILDSSMISSKKMSSLSKNEILLSNEVAEVLLNKINANKEVREGNLVYVLNFLKKEDERTKKFIERFLKRQQSDDF